jgi:hypothetical protein
MEIVGGREDDAIDPTQTLVGVPRGSEADWVIPQTALCWRTFQNTATPFIVDIIWDPWRRVQRSHLSPQRRRSHSDFNDFCNWTPTAER